MISFTLSLVLLIVGYFVYGNCCQKLFLPDNRPTPAIRLHDAVDFVALRPCHAFLIQLLNIAGTGPIFGALMGAAFGPVVFLWIVFGCIFGGAFHDYMSAMISVRNNGASIAEISGKYLGRAAKPVIRIFSIVLLILVGAVFITSPAALLSAITPPRFNTIFWTILILIYYIAASIMPIDKIIGKLYPIFGILLMIMALMIIGAVFAKGYTIPEIELTNFHPQNLPVWPYMFVTVACGAISGFHATQSPIVAKCIQNEHHGKFVFYGAMTAEAVIALIWAAAGSAFYENTSALNTALTTYGQSAAVYEISKGMLGNFGGILAVIGVIACPITTGDTAFRGARIILAEWSGLSQKQIKNRLLITIPLLACGAILTTLDFNILWRYFSWSNQALACVTLWCIAAYLLKKAKKYKSLTAAVPAAFMSNVCITYILTAPEGFKLSLNLSVILGTIVSILMFFIFILNVKNKNI